MAFALHHFTQNYVIPEGAMNWIGRCLAALGYAIGFVGRALNLLLVDERGGAVRGQQAGLHQDPHATFE